MGLFDNIDYFSEEESSTEQFSLNIKEEVNKINVNPLESKCTINSVKKAESKPFKKVKRKKYLLEIILTFLIGFQLSQILSWTLFFDVLESNQNQSKLNPNQQLFIVLALVCNKKSLVIDLTVITNGENSMKMINRGNKIMFETIGNTLLESKLECVIEINEVLKTIGDERRIKLNKMLRIEY
ncbi:unnamed protein product [Brachionus calyciflorus]|uniref:Uncharacterized protein n=1 Tax=Brachionus calyciflorus TaxID=104777 RepID=A0A813QKY2_9BILA|nr:unnamed protein product [Brachionus calyciflorus]